MNKSADRPRWRLASLVIAGLLVASCSASTGTSSHVSYQGYSGTAVVSADGRTIMVGPYLSGGCSATVTAVARESTTEVALFLQGVPSNRQCSGPTEVAASVPAQDIRLVQPLGSRKMVDGATGRAIAWISARLMLRPAALPVGYRLTEVAPAVELGRTESPGPAGVTQFYGSPHGADALEIAQGAGGFQVPGPGTGGWTSIRVRGQSGRATRNLITWRQNGLTDFIVVGRQNGPDEPQVMSTQQLIAIANSSPAYYTGPLVVAGP